MKNRTLSILFFTLAVLSSAFWITSRFVNFNQRGAVSVITEILWLPMLGLLFFLPILSLLLWIKGKYSMRSFFLYAFLLCLATIAFMFASD